MTELRIQLLWGDGSLTRANSWEMAEWKVRQAQWHRYKSKRLFRRDMCRRALAWSKTAVPARGTSEEFLRGLELAGLVRIETREVVR